MAGVLKQAALAPFLELGSSIVSWARILALDIEAEEAVEPSLALSRTGFYDNTPLFHGLSTCFQSHTTYLFVAAPYKVVGSASGDIVMLDGLLRILHISLALVKTWFILFMISSTMTSVSFCLFLFVSPLELAVLWSSVPEIDLSFP